MTPEESNPDITISLPCHKVEMVIQAKIWQQSAIISRVCPRPECGKQYRIVCLARDMLEKIRDKMQGEDKTPEAMIIVASQRL